MPDKTEYTQADFIVGFDSLSESQKAYKLSQKVCINPKYESVRVANRKTGTAYIVSIAGYEYKFDCAEDAWSFEYVRTRAYCRYDDFVPELMDGKVWSSGDVEVKIANKNNNGMYCIELNNLKWTYATAIEA